MWWAFGFPLMSCLSCSPAITVNQGEMGSPQRVTSSQQQTRISASSATRELDELMASLSDFKVPQGPSSSLSCSLCLSYPFPAPQCEQLELSPSLWIPFLKPKTLHCPGLASIRGREGQAKMVGTELPLQPVKAEKHSAGTFLPPGCSQLSATQGGDQEAGTKGPVLMAAHDGGGHSLSGRVGLGILCLRDHLPWSPISHAGCPQHVFLSAYGF